MNIHLAKIISTEGPYLEAKLQIQNHPLHVIDEFSVARSVKNGDDIEIELHTDLLAGESWETIFSGNSDKAIGLERINGCRYKAFGKITGIHPTIVDCGLISVENVVSSNDPAIIGTFIAFTIDRLNAYNHG